MDCVNSVTFLFSNLCDATEKHTRWLTARTSSPLSVTMAPAWSRFVQLLLIDPHKLAVWHLMY
jgi:hypothetical protein